MNNKLNTFENGGSHAENPNGGIPQGMGNNGLPNTVEEGETKMKIKGQDYIFSDRLRTSDDFVKKFNLPVYVNKKSFAKASEAIEERFKDRNDNASNSTKAVFMERLAEAQELARLQKEASELGVTVDELLQIKQQEAMAAQQAEMMAQQQEQQGQQMGPDGAQQEMSQEEMPKEMQPTEEFTEEGLPLEPSMMAYGGYMNEYHLGGFEDTNMVARKPVTAVTGTVAPMAPLQGSTVDSTLTPPAGKVMAKDSAGDISGGAVAGALGGIGSLYSMSQNTDGEVKQDEAGSVLSGAATGASAGAALGPWGAAVGGVLGAGVGLFSAGKNNRAFQRKQVSKAQSASAEQTLTENGRAYGGILNEDINMYHDGGYPHKEPHAPKYFDGVSRYFDGFGDKVMSFLNKGSGNALAKRAFPNPSALQQALFFSPRQERLTMEAIPGDPLSPKGTPQAGSVKSTATPSKNIGNTVVAPIQEQTGPTTEIGEEVISEESPFNNFNNLQVSRDYSSSYDKIRDLSVTKPFDAASQRFYSFEGGVPEEEIKKDSNLGQYAALGMQAAPFLGNIYEGMSLDAPDPNNMARAGRTYIPNFADERAMLNVVDESYGGTDRALAEASSGNLGAYRSNLLGANIGKTKARSEAYRQISDINRAEEAALNKDFADAIKEGVATTNLERDLDKQDRSAYERQKRDYRIAAYEGLGKLGETIFKTNQMDDLSTYNIFGNKSLTAAQKKAAKEAAKKAVEDKE